MKKLLLLSLALLGVVSVFAENYAGYGYVRNYTSGCTFLGERNAVWQFVERIDLEDNGVAKYTSLCLCIEPNSEIDFYKTETIENDIEEGLRYKILSNGEGIEIKYTNKKGEESEFLFGVFKNGNLYCKNKKGEIVEYKFSPKISF